MNFRVTQQFTAAAARDHIARQSGEVFRVQQQISTGLRMQRPADDPAGTRRSLIQKDRIERLLARTSSMQIVQSRVEQAHVHLREAGNLIQRAHTISLSAQQALDATEVQAHVSELNGILEQLLSVANSMDESGYLFSGTASLTTPFPDLNTDSGVSFYAGTSDTTRLNLSSDISRDILLPGDYVFQPSRRQPTLIIGRTGAASGPGTDTATGTRELLVRHTVTTFSPGSGITAGVSSADGNTILGTTGTHQLEIIDHSGDGTSGTISLNGGIPVQFSSLDTDLAITGPRGEQVFVNTTAISAGFTGTVALTAEGTMSVDGGLTEVGIDFSAGQRLADSRDGSVVFIDSSEIARVGTDLLEFPGTTDVFAAVTALRDDLLNTRNLSPSDRSAALSRRIGDLERVHDHLLNVLGVQSVNMEHLDRLRTRTADLTLAEHVAYSETTSADIAAAVLRLQELQNLQQFTLATAARMLTPSLLNFLR